MSRVRKFRTMIARVPVSDNATTALMSSRKNQR